MAIDVSARIRRVRDDLVQMGRTVDVQLRKVLDALTTLDRGAAAEVVLADAETDRREVAIERECLRGLEYMLLRRKDL